MSCPICKKEQLEKEIFHNTQVDYCPTCLGMWFEEDELKWAKDQKDKELSWLDIDLWKDPEKFKVSVGQRRLCPTCRMPLYEVYYGDSGVIVDVCNLCHGIWLDRKEFLKIINWLKEKADYEVLNNYSVNLIKQFGEIFSGPELLREEIADFLIVLKLLSYKIPARYPVIFNLILIIPK